MTGTRRIQRLDNRAVTGDDAPRTPKPFRRTGSLAAACLIAATVNGCEETDVPTEATLEQPLPHFSQNSAANADKGYIDGFRRMPC